MVSAAFLVLSTNLRDRFATLDEKSKDSDGDGRALKRSRASEIGTIKIVFRECVKTGEKSVMMRPGLI